MRVISSEKYADNSYYYVSQGFVKDIKYNSLFIILSFAVGTAIGYLLINEKESIK